MGHLPFRTETQRMGDWKNEEQREVTHESDDNTALAQYMHGNMGNACHHWQLLRWCKRATHWHKERFSSAVVW